VIFREELLGHAQSQRDLRVLLTLTRESSITESRATFTRRVDEMMLREILASMTDVPMTTFVCGNNGFVGTVADALIATGVASESIRTERYGE
jgi:ferredoxin-NADP reductase